MTMALERGYFEKRNNMKRMFLLGLYEQAHIMSTELYKTYYFKTWGVPGLRFKVFCGIHLDGSLVSFTLEMDREYHGKRLTIRRRL